MGTKLSKKATEFSTESSAPRAYCADSTTFTLTKRELASAIALLKSVADPRSTMPILQDIVMRFCGDDIVMTATDLNVTMRVRVACHVSRRGKGMTVNAKRFADAVKSLPDGDVTVSGLEHGGATLDAGSARISVAGHSDRDTPKFPEITDEESRTYTTVCVPSLATLFEQTLPTVCKDETRFHLNGIFLQSSNGRTVAVSTDGHRLAKASAELCCNALDASLPLRNGVIIPAKGAKIIAKAFGKAATCDIAVTPRHTWVRIGATTVAVKHIDAQFPPYEQVIPKNATSHALIDVERLLAVAKRAKAVCTATRGLTLELASGNLRVFADNPDTGEMSETLPAEHEGLAAWRMGVNPEYLVAALELMGDDRVVLSVASALDPMLVRSVDDFAMKSHGVRDELLAIVVMPMRLD